MPYSFIRFLTVFIFIALSAPASANAVKINDEGAAALKEMLDKNLEQQKSLFDDMEMNLVTKGEITVEKAESYYAATFPAITYNIDGETAVNLGMIALNAVPIAKDGDDYAEWKMSVAFPTPILITSAQDQVRIDIGGQKSGGVWSKELEHYSKFSGQYDDIRISSSAGDDIFVIGKTAITTDLTENNNLWSGPSNFVTSNIALNNAAQENLFQLDDITVNTVITNYDPVIYKEFLDTFKVSESFDFEKYMQAVGDMTGRISVNGLKISDLKEDESFKGIDHINMGFKSKGAKEGMLNQDIQLEYKGLDMLNKTTMDEIVPRSFKTSMMLKNFPLKDIIDFVSSAGDIDPTNKDAQKMLGMQALMSLPQKLAAAGTTLELAALNMKADDYDFTANGEIKAQNGSAFGGVGQMLVQLQGLETLMEKLATDPKGQMLIQQLMMFKQISAMEGDKNVVMFKLTETGELTVNDKPLNEAMTGE